jgi:hypothetical protein
LKKKRKEEKAVNGRKEIETHSYLQQEIIDVLTGTYKQSRKKQQQQKLSKLSAVNHNKINHVLPCTNTKA